MLWAAANEALKPLVSLPAELARTDVAAERRQAAAAKLMRLLTDEVASGGRIWFRFEHGQESPQQPKAF